MTSAITCRIHDDVTPEEVADLYVRSGLQRPTDARRVQRMLETATVLITARDAGNRLIGFARAYTDYVFDCFLNDLAVDPTYQKQGIGQELIHQLRTLLEDDTLIVLLSAKTATGFYERLGFKQAPGAYGMPHKK